MIHKTNHGYHRLYKSYESGDALTHRTNGTETTYTAQAISDRSHRTYGTQATYAAQAISDGSHRSHKSHEDGDAFTHRTYGTNRTDSANLKGLGYGA